jgi:DNA-binding transcriptional LysR family regulator
MVAQPSGVLRASLPVDFASTYLAPLIAEFAGKYPGIRFDFDLTPRVVDLVSEPFDVAIRMGTPPDSNLIARQLANLSAYLYASPMYLKINGEPTNPAELTQHECLGFRTLKTGTWAVHNAEEKMEVPISGRVQLNSVGLTRKLAAQGMGIVMLPGEIVADDVAQGKLRRILPDWEGPPTPVYAMTETRLLPAKTQRFIEFLREHLAGPISKPDASEMLTAAR